MSIESNLELYATRYGRIVIAFCFGAFLPVIPAALAVRELAVQVDAAVAATAELKAKSEIIFMLHEPLPANEAAAAASFVAQQLGVKFDVPLGVPAPRWAVACGTSPMLIGPPHGEVFFAFNPTTKKIEGPFVPAVAK